MATCLILSARRRFHDDFSRWLGCGQFNNAVTPGIIAVLRLERTGRIHQIPRVVVPLGM